MRPATHRKKSILVVDDDRQMRRMILEACRRDRYICFESAGASDALAVIDNEKIDLVITDIVMPEMNGIELTQEIKKRDGPDVIMVTGFAEDFSYGEAIAKGASDFIHKPFELKELSIRIKRVFRERALRNELALRLQQTMTALEGVIHALSMSIDARDPYTSGHQKRVTDLAVAIGRQLGLSEERITGIRMAGAIHDLGKIGVPAEILSRPTRLSGMEYSLVKTHCEVGYNILKKIDFPWPIAETVYQHHERLDGSGYPRGLKRDDILIEAKIMAVADVVEAIASHRPYRPAFGIDSAVDEVIENRGKKFDAEIVDACRKIVSENHFTFK
jgi:HD-GYP domain-containing protein (c-di-GMP phosphodiesterase class II)